MNKQNMIDELKHSNEQLRIILGRNKGIIKKLQEMIIVEDLENK